MTYPKRVNKFIPWSKAMVAGATVDKPSYPGTSKPSKKSSMSSATRRRRRKKRRRKKTD